MVLSFIECGSHVVAHSAVDRNILAHGLSFRHGYIFDGADRVNSDSRISRNVTTWLEGQFRHRDVVLAALNFYGNRKRFCELVNRERFVCRFVVDTETAAEIQFADLCDFRKLGVQFHQTANRFDEAFARVNLRTDVRVQADEFEVTI